MTDPKPPVTIDIFPEPSEDGAWSYEIGYVDTALHKIHGNPLNYDWTCDDEAEAKLSATLWCKAEGYPVSEIRYYTGREGDTTPIRTERIDR